MSPESQTKCSGSHKETTTESEKLVTDAFVAKSSSFYAGPLKVTPLHGEDVAKAALANATVNVSMAPKLDAKESLEWLLGTEEDAHLPTDEKLAKRERRFDLLIWLLNLEPRLGNYGGDPQPG